MTQPKRPRVFNHVQEIARAQLGITTASDLHVYLIQHNVIVNLNYVTRLWSNKDYLLSDANRMADIAAAMGVGYTELVNDLP